MNTTSVLSTLLNGRATGPMTPSDALGRALRRGLALLLVLMLLRSVPFLVSNSGAYRPPAAEWAAFALLGLVTVVLTGLALADRPIGRLRLPLLVTVLGVSVTATAAVPPDRLFSSAHWSWFAIGWFLVNLFLDEGIRVIAAVLAVHLALVVVQASLTAPLDRLDLAQFAIRGILFTGGQIGMSTTIELSRRVQERAAQYAGERARSLTERRIADEVLADDQARHAALATTAVPLLQGLGTGTLRPDDPEVRLRCRIEATRLRRRMAEADRTPNPLDHELRACADLAERAGVQVDVSFRGSGDGARPSLETRRRLTEPVIATLAGARDRARVTVVESSADVVVSVVADSGDSGEEAMRPEWVRDTGDDVEVDVVRSPGQVWVTARWGSA